MLEITLQRGNETKVLVPDETWVRLSVQINTPDGTLKMKIRLPRELLSLPENARKMVEWELIEGWKDMIEYVQE